MKIRNKTTILILTLLSLTLSSCAFTESAKQAKAQGEERALQESVLKKWIDACEFDSASNACTAVIRSYAFQEIFHWAPTMLVLDFDDWNSYDRWSSADGIGRLACMEGTCSANFSATNKLGIPHDESLELTLVATSNSKNIELRATEDWYFSYPVNPSVTYLNYMEFNVGSNMNSIEYLRYESWTNKIGFPPVPLCKVDPNLVIKGAKEVTMYENCFRLKFWDFSLENYDPFNPMTGFFPKGTTWKSNI